MSLFQKSVEQKFLNELDSKILDTKFFEFQRYFGNPVIQENIRNSKEEQFQEGFLRELFVKILGYTLNPEPDFNLTTELKNIANSKKADGAILRGSDALAVIELKSTSTTNLDSVESQAFGYKNHNPKCIYIITSNFEKIRFYIQNAVEYFEFNLFNLTRDQFSLLWLCLAKENLLSDVSLSIKVASVLKEENVTKELYADYSNFRNDLFNNLVKDNPDQDKLLLFRKTQKLLDRFLFILFAEDRQLLPPNSISEILKQWKSLKDDLDAYVPLYNRFKKYFGYLNTGHKGKIHDIYAYNGGSFIEDKLLDNIGINDDLLYKHTIKLSSYNFNSEVDVNILGHIFEHSLNEIENVQAALNGINVEHQKTKRKKDGIFYTPKYITKYIVENTVGKLCGEKKAEFQIIEEEFIANNRRTTKTKQLLLNRLKTYRSWLLQITICDPACGSGAFLNQALDFLIAEHRYIDELQAKLFGDTLILSDIEKSILENNLFGVDLNEESVEIAKLSLWLRTAQPNRKLNDLNNNIKCGNSLIDDPSIVGDKAFNWRKEFPQVFNKGGFDVVIGNPPYVRAELISQYSEWFKKTYKTYQPAADLFTYFYEIGFSITNSGGLFGYISNAFDKTKAAIELRNWLKNNTTILKYVDFTDVQIFEGATTYPIIYIAKNQEPISNQFQYIKILKGNEQGITFHNPAFIPQSNLEKENWAFRNIESYSIIKKIQLFPIITLNYGKCYYGIKTALNEAFIIPKEKFNKNEFIKPYYEGRELNKWTNNEYIQSLILFKSKWTKTKFGNLTEIEALEKTKELQPDLMQHLLPFEKKAKARFDKGDYWWELRNCAYYQLFEHPKIVFPNLQNSNKFSLDENGIYINAPAVMLSLAHLKNPVQEGKFLLGILNSKLIWYFLKSICVVRSGGYIEVKPQYFEQIPVPSIPEEVQKPLADLTDNILTHVRVYQEIRYKFQRTIQRKFGLDDLPNKLQKWNQLSYRQFISELGKHKCKLTLSEEAEWESYFLQESSKVSELISKIDSYEKEVNQLVYSLYGLTEEEIKTIEGN